MFTVFTVLTGGLEDGPSSRAKLPRSLAAVEVQEEYLDRCISLLPDDETEDSVNEDDLEQGPPTFKIGMQELKALSTGTLSSVVITTIKCPLVEIKVQNEALQASNANAYG